MQDAGAGQQKRDSTNRWTATFASVNRFLLTPITKRLYEDLAEQDLLWRVAGYLGSLDNKLRNDRVFWGVTLAAEGSIATDSLKLTIPEEVLQRSAQPRRATMFVQPEAYASRNSSRRPRSRCTSL